MRNFILFDDESWKNLLPLTFTRPVGEIRIGILRIREKWEKYLETKISYLTQDYLSEKFTLKKTNQNILINASIIPDLRIIEAINNLEIGEVLIKENTIIASYLEDFEKDFFLKKTDNLKKKTFSEDIFKINYAWEIFQYNEKALNQDFELITKNRKSAKISTTNRILNEENIFVEEGSKIEFATLNASEGYIYIGKNTEIMEGAMIRGSFALCDNSTVKMGAKIYGKTTIGEHCKVAGEISNSILMGFSNKAHDGYLGNAVLGHWCNLGADTNNSNLKNNYADVKLWNYTKDKFIDTGLQFCGLIMGDHSKTAINTMFNTGTVIGVSANIFGAGFPRIFVPSFSWGGANACISFRLDKVFNVIEKVMKRRNKSDIEINQEKEILKAIEENTKKYRKF